MSGKISLALLASVSCLCFANQAAAFDAQRPGERMIYSYQSPQPAPRMAYAERSQMGGGFIEFLFGDGPQGGRYQQQPSYEQQPGYGGRRMLLPPMDPQQSMRQQEIHSQDHLYVGGSVPKWDGCCLDGFVADFKAFKRTNPNVRRFFTDADECAAGDDARRVRPDT